MMYLHLKYFFQMWFVLLGVIFPISQLFLGFLYNFLKAVKKKVFNLYCASD